MRKPAPRVAQPWLRALLVLGVVALTAGCGGALQGLPTPPSGTPDPAGEFTFPPFEMPTPAAEGGTPSGTRWRVANLLTRGGQPVEVDVVSQNALSDQFSTLEVLRATVPYGQASEWFDPGLAELGKEIYVSMDFRPRGESQSLVSAGSRGEAEPGDAATVILAADELFDEMSPSQMIFFHDLRNFSLADFDPSMGTVIVSGWGVPASDGDAQDDYLYAGVGGQHCLVNAQSGEQPFPAGQPISLGSSSISPMAVEPGSHQLTLHPEDAGEDFATCQNDPVGPTIPIEVEAGDHVLVLLYGASVEEMQAIVLAGDD
jgi:hypothetical protein